MKKLLLSLILIPSICYAGPELRLLKAIRDAGVPVESVHLKGNTAEDVRVSFKPEATKAEKDAAAAVVAGFDFSEKPATTRAEIRAALAAMTTAQRNAIILDLLATIAEKDPRLQTQLGFEAR